MLYINDLKSMSSQKPKKYQLVINAIYHIILLLNYLCENNAKILVSF